LNDYFLSKNDISRRIRYYENFKKCLMDFIFLLLAMAIISVVFDFYCSDIIVLIYAFVCFVLGTISFLNVLKK